MFRARDFINVGVVLNIKSTLASPGKIWAFKGRPRTSSPVGLGFTSTLQRSTCWLVQIKS